MMISSSWPPPSFFHGGDLIEIEGVAALIGLDAQRLLLVTHRGDWQIWDLTGRNRLRHGTLSNKGYIQQIVVHPSHRQLAFADAVSFVMVDLDTMTARERFTVDRQSDLLRLAFNADGQTLLIVSESDEDEEMCWVCVWDVDASAPLWLGDYPEDLSELEHVTLSPDGRTISLFEYGQNVASLDWTGPLDWTIQQVTDSPQPSGVYPRHDHVYYETAGGRLYRDRLDEEGRFHFPRPLRESEFASLKISHCGQFFILIFQINDYRLSWRGSYSIDVIAVFDLDTEAWCGLAINHEGTGEESDFLTAYFAESQTLVSYDTETQRVALYRPAARISLQPEVRLDPVLVQRCAVLVSLGNKCLLQTYRWHGPTYENTRWQHPPDPDGPRFFFQWLPSPTRASSEVIAETEARLNVRLPPFYRAFVSVANGWENFHSHPCYRLYRILPIEETRWVRDDADFIASLNTNREGQQHLMEGVLVDMLIVGTYTLANGRMGYLLYAPNADPEGWRLWTVDFSQEGLEVEHANHFESFLQGALFSSEDNRYMARYFSSL